MNRGAWRATVHGVTKSRTRLKRLSMHTPGLQADCLMSEPSEMPLTSAVQA